MQVVLSLGIVVAQWINLGTALLDPWGWRLSLALAGLPAIVLTVGGLLLPETPNSLIERGLVSPCLPSAFFGSNPRAVCLEMCSTLPSEKKEQFYKDKNGMQKNVDNSRACAILPKFAGVVRF